MRNVIIAGGQGFLGNHLAAALLKDGDRVLSLDSGISFTPVPKYVIEHHQYRHITMDIRNPISSWKIEGWLREAGVDAIYNLASIASPWLYQKFPILTLETNFIGTENLLNVAQMHGARFFQASTSEVYGNPTVPIQSEAYLGNVNTFGPRACYDEGKRVAESLCYNMIREHGVDVRVGRIFNTYGPGMNPDDGRMIPAFLGAALRGRPIQVFGNGAATRSLCYVTDTIDALREVMDVPESAFDPGIGHRLFNIGNPYEYYTVLEVAHLCRATVESAEMPGRYRPALSFIENISAVPDDPALRRPDISHILRTTQWQGPTIGLQEGLKTTCQYMIRRMSS